MRPVTPKAESARESFLLRAGGASHRRSRRDIQIPQNQTFVFDLQGQASSKSANAHSLLPKASLLAMSPLLAGEGVYYIISNYGDANSKLVRLGHSYVPAS